MKYVQSGSLILAVALDGAGWHPAAWRDERARPGDLSTPGYWVDLARTAERGGVDFVTFEDAFTIQSDDPRRPDDRHDQVRGRLDAALVAARVAPATTSIGLVPTVTTTHTEPFLVSTRIASLDFVSTGRAGWRPRVLHQRAELGHFGRRALGASGDDVPSGAAELLLDEAGEVIEVVRRLWDSWEDDAEIRDVATGRFIDRDRLHYVDFHGDHFSVRGPSITPRSPQGQPPVVVLAHTDPAYRLAAAQADVVLVTPRRSADVERIVDRVRSTEALVRRRRDPLRILAEVVVLIEADDVTAGRELARLDGLAGTPLRSDAAIVAGTPGDLADLVGGWRRAGIDGVRLRPARLPADLDAITERLVPALRRRGLRPDTDVATTLRERLGLARPESRYAPGAAVAVGAS